MYQYWVINYDKCTILIKEAVLEETEYRVYGNFKLAKQPFSDLKLLKNRFYLTK